MTIDQMVSMIMSDIGSGLKEVGNYPYTFDLIKAKINSARSTIIHQLSKTGELNRDAFAQKYINQELKYDTFPYTGFNESERAALYMKVPKLTMTADNSSIIYLGPPDMSLNISTYYDVDSLKSHRYSRVIKNRPYSFVDPVIEADGTTTIYFFNLGPTPFKFATIYAIFDDPMKVIDETEGGDGFVNDQEFPAPQSIQEAIIDQIVERVRALYREYGGQNEPNDQTDKT
jgi:hypothetical protein